MRLIAQTDEQLLLEHRPFLFTGILGMISVILCVSALSDMSQFGIFKLTAAFLFAALAIYNIERAKLTIDGARGIVEHWHVTRLRSYRHSFPIVELKWIPNETLESSEANTHRFVLNVKSAQMKGQYPLTKSYMARLDQSIIYKVNTWLAHRSDTGHPADMAD